MTETDQNDQNVSSNSDSKRMSRTRSVIGPRPFPSSHSLRKKNNDRVSEDYSNSLTPEQSRSGTPDQPFPPLVSPKPQKPMPTVTADITNALETKDFNENCITSEYNKGILSTNQQDQASQNYNTYNSQRPPSPQSPSFQPPYTNSQQFYQTPQPLGQQQQQQYMQHQQYNHQYYGHYPSPYGGYQYQPTNLGIQQYPQYQSQIPQEYSNITQVQSHTGQPVLLTSPYSTNSSVASHDQQQFDQNDQKPKLSITTSLNSQTPSNNSIPPRKSSENYKHSSLLIFSKSSSGGSDSLVPPISHRGDRNSWHGIGSTPDRKSPVRLLIDEKNARRQTATSITLTSDENAIQKYREAAKKTNDPNTQLHYANFLLHMVELRKSNISKNPEKIDQEDSTTDKLTNEATYWINHLVKIDNPEALYIKGTWYEYGKYGKEQNEERAFKLYQTSSKKEFPKAKYKVALYHEKKDDYKRAIQFYKKAAAQGEVAALYRLSLIYLLGESKQSVDFRQALIYLKQAASKADEDCPDGAYVYGMILAREWDQTTVPDELVAPDDYEARELILKAANLGHVPALFKIGSCYEFGSLGFLCNPILSVEYYKRAAEKGHAEADMSLSKWYLCGAENYFDKNEALAYEHAEKAALKGLATAEFAMGYFHENGIHVPINLGTANIWYTKAASHGNEDAKRRLANDVLTNRKENGLKKEKRPDKDKDCVIQ